MGMIEGMFVVRVNIRIPNNTHQPGFLHKGQRTVYRPSAHMVDPAGKLSGQIIRTKMVVSPAMSLRLKLPIAQNHRVDELESIHLFNDIMNRTIDLKGVHKQSSPQSF